MTFFKKVVCLFAACAICGAAQAVNYNNFESDGLSAQNLLATTNQQKSDNYQIAKSVFLPEIDDSEVGWGDREIDGNHNSNNCDGYTLKTCPDGGYCISCPFNRRLYTLKSCGAPYIMSGNSCTCPAAKPLTCTNDKCSKYCGSTCIEKSCTPTKDETGCTNGTQTCDNGCCANTRKCCVPCVDTVTTKPENSSYTTSSCTDSNGSHQIQTGWTCNSGYHQTGSTCTKDCIIQSCSGYSLTNCPAHGVCSSCTKTAASCATDGTYKKLDSCESGYTKSGNTCVEAPSTCEDWIRKNYSGVTVITSSSQSLSGSKIAVLTNVNASYGATIPSGGFIVGPKYFNYDKCQSMATPTITVSSKTSAAVNLSGGTVSDLKVHFDPIVYEIWGKSGVCSYQKNCESNAQYSSFYNYIKDQSYYISCDNASLYDPKNETDFICIALNNAGRDCYDSYNQSYKDCDSSYYGSCTCSNANQMACYAFYDASDYCANNEHGAIEGYGTVKNVSLTTKSGMSVAKIIDNTSGTMTLSGTNSLVGSTLSSRRGSSARATNVVVADGTTTLHIGDSFTIGGTLTVNKGATLNVEYAELGGLSIGSGGTVNVAGKLNIASYGTGGKFNNDMELNKGVVNAKSTGCIILKNGAGGSGGYVGSVTSGTYNFESGSQLKIGGTCRTAYQNGSASVGDQPKPNNLYGNFTSPPSGYSGSCSSCS